MSFFSKLIGGGVSGIGRSYEKKGISNNLTNLATGSGFSSLFNKKAEG